MSPELVVARLPDGRPLLVLHGMPSLDEAGLADWSDGRAHLERLGIPALRFAHELHIQEASDELLECVAEHLEELDPDGRAAARRLARALERAGLIDTSGVGP